MGTCDCQQRPVRRKNGHFLWKVSFQASGEKITYLVVIQVSIGQSASCPYRGNPSDRERHSRERDKEVLVFSNGKDAAVFILFIEELLLDAVDSADNRSVLSNLNGPYNVRSSGRPTSGCAAMLMGASSPRSSSNSS